MSRRMLFWSGCAAAVTTAVSVYFAADYSCQHPHSLAARCVRRAVQLGLQCWPIQSVIAHARHQEMKEDVPTKPTAARPQPPAVEPQEVIDLTQAGVGTAPLPVSEKPQRNWASLEQKAETLPDETSAAVPPVIVPAGDFEEGEEVKTTEPAAPAESEVPATMPPCAEDEVPATMLPCSDEEETSNAPKPLPRESRGDAEKGGVEESEAVPQGKPSDCQVDPQDAEQYPGCPSMNGCPRSKEMSPPTHIDELAPPRRPSVDTMEFRKSDARKGEFKPHVW